MSFSLEPGTEVARFVARLRQLGRRRLDQSALWSALVAIDRAASVAPDRRQRLRSLLDAAEAAGALVATRGRPDRSADPELPRSITLAPTTSRAVLPRRGAVWPPELAFAASLELREDERRLLDEVRAFLRDLRPDEPVVPIRERSIELTGDEKRLEQYLDGRLFAPGKLSLELLRCKLVHPPFVWREVGDGSTLLVVENHQTFDTLARLIAPDEGIALLAYGCGNQFTASVGFVAELPRRVERILYYGDLDLEGLRIPARASIAAQAAGLPAVEPAAGLYRALLELGRRGAGRRASAGEVRAATEWLSLDLRESVCALLERGERLAQEGLGFSRLRDAELRRRALCPRRATY